MLSLNTFLFELHYYTKMSIMIKTLDLLYN